jgi:glucose-6-phosphate isomerase
MSKGIKIERRYLEGFVSEAEIEAIKPEVEKAHSTLMERTGAGNDFLGWLDLPEEIDGSLLERVEKCANKLRANSDLVIVVGIGGSYLGAKAAIEFLSPELKPKKVIFAGYNISGDYLEELSSLIKEKDVSVNVISKSGTTTEPALAFRVICSIMEQKYSEEELKERIVCTTDSSKGALRTLAEAKGYETFVIPDDVGGRFSVLTPVGLLPIACEGIDIRGLIDGARQSRTESRECDLTANMSYLYAAIRNILYRKGKVIEISSNFDKKFHYISEWWKQLFGESEGKDGKAIFPASCDFTTDLHSMGQWAQDGTRNIFETFLIAEDQGISGNVPKTKDDLDNLNYLAGKSISYVNEQAYKATAEAHFEGGVPNLTIILPEKSPRSLGMLLYFFEKAVAISAYMWNVNPFNQPGVESYKTKMFKLLGKPGV